MVVGPWGVVGDFNVITSADKKIGGRPYKIEESFDFIAYLADGDLQDAGFLGSLFTWSDNRDPPNTIWKRLDRLVYNSEWFDQFGGTSVTHLSRSCSDHAPLLITCAPNNTEYIRYFRFLNIWADHDNFLEVVQQAWALDVSGNPLLTLHQKIKNTCKSLSLWSREAFGEVY